MNIHTYAWYHTCLHLYYFIICTGSGSITRSIYDVVSWTCIKCRNYRSSVKYHHQAPRFSNFSKSQKDWYKKTYLFWNKHGRWRFPNEDLSSSNPWISGPMLVLDVFFFRWICYFFTMGCITFFFSQHWGELCLKLVFQASNKQPQVVSGSIYCWWFRNPAPPGMVKTR